VSTQYRSAKVNRRIGGPPILMLDVSEVLSSSDSRQQGMIVSLRVQEVANVSHSAAGY
jgi:hypothetical protein